MPEPQVSSDTWTLQWQFHHNWLLPFVSCSPHGDTVLLTGWGFLCRLLWVALLAGLIVWLALDTGRNPEQLISLGGFWFLVLFLFACSKHHDAVRVSGVTWPSVPLQEVATQHWRISTSFPLASPSLEEAEAQQSWAELGTACGAELVGWVDPKATSLLFFALLSFPTQGSHTLPLSCFLPCPSWWVRPKKPSTRPTPELQVRWLEDGPEFQVPWGPWSEIIEVPVASSSNCCNALGSPPILLLQRVIEQPVSV